MPLNLSKKSITLVIIFLVSIAVLLNILISDSKPNSPLPQAFKPTAMPSSEAQLSFSPNPLISTTNLPAGRQGASIDVVLEINAALDLIQLEIAYDPEVLYNVNIAPGNYLSNPEVVLENIDISTGRISYALKGTPANAESDIVATVNFSSLNYGPQKETEIKFLPKTLVKENNEVIKLKTTGAKIILPKLFFIPQASPSGVLMQ